MQIFGQQEGKLGSNEACVVEQQREGGWLAVDRRGTEVHVEHGTRVLRRRALKALPRGGAVDELGRCRIGIQGEVETAEEPM